MDLVVCVDTAVAHIAGALGKPVWLLLPRVGDFRWLLDREDTPWYSTMRLFRQREHGRWADVVERVREALAQAARTRVVPQPCPAPEPGADAPEPPPIADVARVTETRYGVMQYRPDPRDALAASALAWYGEVLQPQVDLLTTLLPPGAHVVEAGAGFGAHTISLARHLGPAGQLWVYEERPEFAAVLQLNVEVNRVGEGITFMRGSLAGPRDASAGTRDGPDTVDALQVARLDMVKLGRAADAAGIIEGAAQTLWRLRPVVFAAMPDDASLEGLAATLREFGYRTFCMRTAYFRPSNFNAREAGGFDGAAALALLAIAEERNLAPASDDCIELAAGVAHAAAKGMPTGTEGRRASALLRWVRKLLR